VALVISTIAPWNPEPIWRFDSLVQEGGA